MLGPSGGTPAAAVRRGRRLMSAGHVLVVLVVLAVLALLGGAEVPAAAAERRITVTSEGVEPQVLRAAPGDTVRFVVEDATFAYRAQSTGGDWRFDSGPVELLSGSWRVPSPLTSSGTYTYRVAQDLPFSGTVLVAGEGLAPTPTPTPTPTAAVTGAPPVPADRPSAPGAAEGAVTPGPADPSPGVGAPSGPATSGPAPSVLAQPAGWRPLGLPAALALLLVVGTASLLLRTLLAESVVPSDPAWRADRGRRPRW